MRYLVLDVSKMLEIFGRTANAPFITNEPKTDATATAIEITPTPILT